MTKPFDTWTVLPHGKLVELHRDILTVTGTIKMPFGDFERRMTLVRLSSGKLVVYSAIALDEAEMSKVEAFGTPAFLVVPHANHRLDAKAWRERYPMMVVVAPRGVRHAVNEVVDVDVTDVDFGDPRVHFFDVPGTDGHEGALVVETDAGTNVMLSDLVFNLANRPGLSGWLFKLMGVTGDEPHLPGIVKMRDVKEPAALAAQFRAWASKPGLRVVPAHGAVIEHDAAAVLESIAKDLAA